MTHARDAAGGADPRARRDLLARLLRERASGEGETCPLSSGQQALWFLYRLAPESPGYNVAFCGRVRSIIDRARLEYAIGRVMERHSMLRCTVALTEEGPRQRVGPVPEKPLEEVDASGWSEEELRSRVRDAYRRPFDLMRGPVFRAVLFRRREADHVLLLAVHHIAFDGWSLGFMLKDLDALYREGPTASLSGVRKGYADFVRWQRDMLASPEGQEKWAYWRNRLAGPLPSFQLPTDHVRPGVETFRGATHRFELPEELCGSLREFARTASATPFMVLAAAFHALLHRYSGQPEVLIGTPLAGRPLREFEGVVGYFVNPVVLRVAVAPGTTFRTHLADMREAVLGALKHGDYPFMELVKRLQPERDKSRTPLVQVMFNLMKTSQIGVAADAACHDGDVPSRLGGLEIESFPLEQQEGVFDLDLNVLDTGRAMAATLRYSTDLFEAGTIERMAGHFRTLLEGAMADPDRRIAELPVLSAAETRRMLVEWNRTEGEHAAGMTLHELFEAQADRTPDAIAVVSEAGQWSYRAVAARASRIAGKLRALGVRSGDIVALFAERSVELVAAMIGVLKAGGAYLPIDTSVPRDRVAFMLGDARVAAVLAGPGLRGEVPGDDALVLGLEDEPGLDVADAGPPRRLAGPESLAYVIYTSGSTGRPKGTEIQHRAIVNYVQWKNRALPLGSGDAAIHHISIGFDPSGLEIWPTLTSGARVVLAPRGSQGDPALLVQAIANYGVTEVVFVPSLCEVVVREPGFARCTGLRRILLGGEALSRALVEKIWAQLDVEVVNLYGPTEATINATAWTVGRGGGPHEPMVPIGRPIDNLRAYVLDAGMQPVPVGIPGELHLGGLGVARGYLGRPALTAERFVGNPYEPGDRLYKTGDVCRYRTDGTLEFIGRRDYQVKLRGFRIELGEIEAALLDHAAVEQAVVVSREEVRGDVRLAAYMVPRSGASLDSAELRALLRNRLPEYMVPSSFVVLDSLPLTPTGKVDRRALPVPDSARPAAQAQYAAPQTELETAIAAIWKEVLRVERIGIHDNFFDLGGHSLLLMQVQARIEQRMKRRLPVAELFRFPTVAALSRHLASEEDATSPHDRIQDRAERQRQAVSRQRERREKGGNPQ